MSAQLVWNNLLVYSAQIAIVATAAGVLVAALRLRDPAAKLLYWHLSIAACLLLPVLRHWKVEAIAGAVTLSSSVVAVASSRLSAGWKMPPFASIGLSIIGAGIAIRLCTMAIGLWRLRRYRLQSSRYVSSAAWTGEADLRISADIASPVTFGWRKPVILLPPGFEKLTVATREAILCHELLHVHRRDWLWTMAEEIVRAALWFHPAIWWMLGEAQLAREQAVDRAAIETTGERDRYLDALLAIAENPARHDLAPAPLFLKRRHLKQRVVSIVKEVRMSKVRLVTTFAAGAGLLAGVCWMVAGALPLTAAPQNVNDAPGVTVQLAAAPLMHRAPVMYPEEAISKGVEGTVVVQARLGNDGSVVDASVLSGPDELRKAALESVLDWHFDRAAAGSTQQVTIDFALPAPGAATANSVPGGIVIAPVPAGALGAQAPNRIVRSGTFFFINPAEPGEASVVRSIDVQGLSDGAASELQSQIPVHPGDALRPTDLAKITAAVRAFDSHLMVSVAPAGAPGGLAIYIRPQQFPGIQAAIAMPLPAGAVPAPHPFLSGDAGASAPSIRVGGAVQQANIITKVRPIYPPEAKAARVQGLVRFEAAIAPDGHIMSLHVISGPPLLVNAALEAVKQWVYKPTLLNGSPVGVVTTIDVNFTLSQ